MRKPFVKTCILTVAAIMLATPLAWAQEDITPMIPQLPEIQQEGGISYVTGGIGDDEREGFKVARKEYNLHILNSQSNGEFVSDVTITVYDAKENQLLSSEAGPFFYAKMPAGRYVIMASSRGVEQKKKIKVPGNNNIHFIWNN